MSYSILYRSMFVKVSSERYIPLYESGDNNVWECDLRRRARSWQHYYFCSLRGDHNALPFFDGRELLALAERDLDDAVYCGLTVSGIRCTDKKDLMNYWNRAIKRARTFEELASANIHLRVKDRNWNDSEKPHYSCHVNSEEELIKAWQECLEKCGNAEVMPVDDVSDFRYRQLYPKQPKVVKPRSEGYIVTISGHYISSVTSRKFHCTSSMEYAHHYPSRATAEKLKQRIERSNYSSEVIHVRKKDDGFWEKVA